MPFSGERLKAIREQRGLTQRELAALVGTTPIQLSRYENDKMEPSAKYVELLAKHLEITSDYLLGLTDDPRKRFGDTEIAEDERLMIDIFRRDGWPGVIRLGAERISK
jgi:transcriptional regulator with XRE-family HTH domain